LPETARPIADPAATQLATFTTALASAAPKILSPLAYRPAATQLATIEFVGTGGTSLTFSLIGGNNIRDFYQGAFTNLLTNTVPGVNAENAFTCSDPSTCHGAGGTGNVTTGLAGTYVLDEQDFNLGSTFTGQTLTEIITDTHNGSDRFFWVPRWNRREARLLRSPLRLPCLALAA
jgi:hypothetical protein